MIVVTGGAGFIGSNLVAALEARGNTEIIVCDRPGDGAKDRNLAKRKLAGRVTPEALPSFLAANAAEVEAVYHMGAISSTTETDTALLKRLNVDFSMAMWDWCSARAVRLIYASSAATYGSGDQGFDDDGAVGALAQLVPLNAYGKSKHEFDQAVARRVAENGTRPPQWAGLKFFNVYGPNEYHKGQMMSLVAKMYPTAAAGRPARLFKSHHPDYVDGGQLRDFIWVDDCVAIMLWLTDHPEVSGLFNAGTGRARSFADLASATYGALGIETLIEYIDTPAELREQYQYFTQAETTRLRQAGFAAPFTELEEGVRRYVQSYLSRPDRYR